jgi:hypothetical protein
MLLNRCAAIFLLAVSATAAQLPELRIEPTGGGSIFYVKNTGLQPLTAFLIELVDYPGSSYSLFEEDAGQPIPPSGEKRIRVANMTVGAVPDYVKMQAALYGDGSSAGIPEKITELMERRRFLLETTRELIGRVEKKENLKEWGDAMAAPGRADRNSQAAINYFAAKALLSDTVTALKTKTPEEVMVDLRASERALAAGTAALKVRSPR